MDTTDTTPQEKQLVELNEEKERLDRTAKILISKDLELQKAYDSLESAYNQVQAERKELLTERDKLTTVISGISDAIIALDSEHHVVTFNAAAEHTTGYSAGEALGHDFNTLIALRTSNKLINDEVLSHNSLEPGSDVLSMEEVELTGKEVVKTVKLLAKRMAVSTGSNVVKILTIHDMSEQKRLEEMKLDFVSMAAHELRTPLTSISGYLSVFIHENEKMFNAEQMSFLNRISISTQRLYALVENLLSVSKIERKGMLLQKQQTDWVTHLRQILMDFQNSAKEQRVTLTFIEPTVIIPPLTIDPLRIEEVLSNIVSNAINYTKADGHVTVSIDVKDGMVVTNIKDDGPGIPPDAIPFLFTKFFRVSGKLEQGSKGTGLGLYISKAIIDMHKGTIWVTSELGKGSTFSFALPVDTALEAK